MLFSECILIAGNPQKFHVIGNKRRRRKFCPTGSRSHATEGGGLQLRLEGYIAAVDGRTSGAPLAQPASKPGGRDHRGADRFDLNNAPGSLLHKGTRTPCQVIDISLTGCCVRTPVPFTAGSLETVKVTFPIFEMVLSIWGATQWVRGEQLVGIQFRHPTARSKNQLAGLLTCLIDKSATDVVRKAMAEIVNDPSENPILQLEHPPTPTPISEPEPEPEPEPEQVEVAQEPVQPIVQVPRSSSPGLCLTARNRC